MDRSAQMPSTRIGGAFKLTLIFALEIGFIFVLHALGSLDKMAIDFANLKQWMDTTPPEIALVASIRILALVFSYWLLSTSLLYMAARAFNIPILIRALELTTVPGVRRAIDAGLAAAIIGGTVFGGAGAVFAQSTNAQTNAAPAAVTSTYNQTRVLYNPTPTLDTSVGAGDVVDATTPVATSNEKVVVASAETNTAVQTPSADPVDNTTPQKDQDGNYIPMPTQGVTVETQNSKVTIEPGPTVTTAPKVTVPTTTPPVVTTVDPGVQVEGKQVVRPNQSPTSTTPTAPTTAAGTYTVVSGDNFWAIAQAHLQNSLGSEPSNEQVANYWVKLIDANRSNIRSGDPDLIFPGEVFTLPPL